MTMPVLKLSIKNKFLDFRVILKKNLALLWQEKILKIAFISYLVFLILGFILFPLAWIKLPPDVPLFYSLPWGKEQLAKSTYLFILPFSSLIVGLINFSLAAFLTRKEEYLAVKILVWLATIFVVLALFTLVKIIFLII